SRRTLASSSAWRPEFSCASNGLRSIGAVGAPCADGFSPAGWGSTGCCPQHFLYFLPLPQGQGSFLPSFTFVFPALWYRSIKFNRMRTGAGAANNSSARFCQPKGDSSVTAGIDGRL